LTTSSIKHGFVMQGWHVALIFGGFIGYFVGLGLGWLVYGK